MHPSPAHCRFRLAPSGDTHIGHIALGWLSMEAARQTGGTFTMRCQQLWATQDSGSFEKYVQFAQKNMDELQQIGIEPSHRNAFLAHGMSPSWAVQYTDDRGMIDAYWEKLGFDKVWGSWPHKLGSEAHDAVCAVSEGWHSWYLTDVVSNNVLVHQSKHPYISFAQLVGEVTTGRNCIIRGDDHLQDKSFADMMYPVIAKLHYGLDEFDRMSVKTPAQYFLPKLNRTSGVAIRSSSGPASAGYYVKDILAADVQPDRLFKFLGRVLFGTYEAAEKAMASWSQEVPDVPSGPLRVMEQIVERPTICDDEWELLLSSGGKKLP
jgi:hypothetical protein